MGQVFKISVAGGLEPDSLAVAQQLDEVVRVVDSQVEFGDPQDPSNPASTNRAGDDFETPATGAHNGTVSNIAGSWVEVSLETIGTTIKKCYHNLYLDSADTPQYTVPVSGEPNCRWLPFGVMHDGTDKDDSSRMGVDISFVGDTVAVDYIELRFNLQLAGTGVTVSEAHPVLVSLFFTQATRGE
jgi:hypothetical protein